MLMTWETSKTADSMKRFQYLLGQTELFEHFLQIKACCSPVSALARVSHAAG